jgi:glycosidase
VKMKVNTQKLTMSGLLLAVILACAGCGKHSVTPTPTPAKTDTTTTYKDPAQYGTPYTGIPATENMVIYEVNMQTYTPANFQGVVARLDSIKALGANVIWLMPTYPVGVIKSINSPYCVQNPEGVNASFGTLANLQNLVATAHSLGMAVIMDWVTDGTSWDSVWINNTAWYQQGSTGAIISPAGTTYTDIAGLNYNSAAMRIAMIRAMKYWIFTANIDGYRCDNADYEPADFWTQALDTLNTIKTHKLIYLAEGTASTEISSGFQLDYAFSYYSTLKGVYNGSQAPDAIFTTNASEISSIPSTGTKMRYITNHDDASSDGSTLTVYNSKQGALSAFVMAAYMDGIPLIYDSQEVGYPNPISIFSDVQVDYTANPDIVAAYKQILAFRAAHEAVKSGTLTQYNDANIVAFEKKSGTDDVLILVNARNSAETFTLPSALQNTAWKDGFSGASVTLNTQYNFSAYQYVVLSKQ